MVDRVLVTGSSGRIGQAIASRLWRRFDVVGFDRSPSPLTGVVADLRDDTALRRAMRRVAAVVHTAALHAPHVAHASQAEFEAVNVEGTRAVARACLEAGVARLVFTSTTALYGAAATPADDAGWVTEDTVPQPRTVYHRTKLAAEALLREAAQDNALHVTVLRMARCFPEPAPLMARYRLHRGIDARDVAAAHEAALAPARQPFRLYVVSGRTPFAPGDARRLKRDAAALLRERVPGLAAAFDARGWALPASIDRVYASTRAERELGWVPRHGWDEVLRQLDDGSPEVLPPRRVTWPREE